MLKKFRSLNHVQIIAELYMQHEFEVDGEKIRISDSGYKFKWDERPVNRFGQCRYNRKEIGLSVKPTEVNLKDHAWKIQDTILHEIAHAIERLMYGTSGHGLTWRRIAKQIGCDGKRTYDESKINSVRTKWTLRCPVCGDEISRVRRPKRSQSCGRCSSTYNPKYKLEIIQNY